MPESVGFLSAWLLGLSLGLTACTVTCLPYMGAWVMARERGLVLADTGLFLAGRVSAYALLGLVAGLAGVWLAAVLRSGLGHFAIGTASIAAGLWLILGEGRHRPCGVAKGAGAPPFALGFSLSLTPCAPLASLLAFAAQSGSPSLGAAYGLAFGLGAAVTPLLLLLPLLGMFAARLKTQQTWLGVWLKRGAGGVLLVLGMYRISLGI
jgi:sulfite exporter TauE/SafE